MTLVLVSGGTGLVGRYIVEDLIGHGYAVRVGARTKPSTGLFSSSVEHTVLDLDPDADNSAAFKGVEHFVHAAFHHLPGRYRGGEGDDPERFRRLNLDGSAALFNAARNAGLRRCVFLSSRAVYDGLPTGQPLSEDADLVPTSLYGEIKLGCERALIARTVPGFCGTSLRLTGVYGHLRPNKWDSLISDYIAGQGVTSRAGTEVHGKDVGQAVRLMLEGDESRIGGQVYNVSDILADTHDILSIIQGGTGCTHPLPTVADKARVRQMQTRRIAALGWKPGGKALFEKTVRAFLL